VAARRQSPGADAAPEPVILGEVIDHCLLDVRYSIASRDIAVEVDCASSLRVVAHTSDLARVITNLLTNAVKFSPRGGGSSSMRRGRTGP
jgi:signal transduction histidine kinase